MPSSRPAGTPLPLVAAVSALVLATSIALNLTIEVLTLSQSLTLPLLGVALACLAYATPRAVVWSQGAGAAIFILSLVPITGYAYGAEAPGSSPANVVIAVAMLAASIGVLAARSSVGPMSLFTAGTAAAAARRLILGAVAGPLVAGYLVIAGERAGVIDTRLGTAALVVLTVAVLLIGVWRLTLVTARRDAAIQELEREPGTAPDDLAAMGYWTPSSGGRGAASISASRGGSGTPSISRS